MLHEYHVICSARYYPRLHVTAVGLGTHYPWIRGSACISFHNIHTFISVRIQKRQIKLWMSALSMANTVTAQSILEVQNKKKTNCPFI